MRSTGVGKSEARTAPWASVDFPTLAAARPVPPHKGEGGREAIPPCHPSRFDYGPPPCADRRGCITPKALAGTESFLIGYFDNVRAGLQG